MPRVSQVYGGTYLTGADLGGKAHRLPIEAVAVEEVGDEREEKLVASFAGAKKSLVLNKTNASTLVGAFGDDTDAWTGRVVELFTMPVQFNGRTFDAIRLRPVQESTTKLMAPTNGDDVPTPVGVSASQTKAALKQAHENGENCPF